MRKLLTFAAAIAPVAAFAMGVGLAGGTYAHDGGNHCVTKGPGHGGCGPEVGGMTVTKTLELGPVDSTGTAIDLDDIFGLIDPDVDDILTENDQDAGAVGIGLDEPQSYWFKIDIVDEDGNVIFDTVPAEYNFDPDLQDVTDVGEQVTCDPGNAIDCSADDDICHDRGGFVVACTGVVATGDCTFRTDQPPSAAVKGERFKEPEFITIEVGTATGDCMVDVFVITDGNPGHFDDALPLDFSLFEPTSCLAFRDENGDLIEDGDGDPIVDTIALNDGVKIFDADDTSGKRLSGPEGSLQLVPIGCDSDEDGVIDELDQCPVEAAVIDADLDGCEDA